MPNWWPPCFFCKFRMPPFRTFRTAKHTGTAWMLFFICIFINISIYYMKAIICLVLAGSVSAGVSSCSRSSKDVVTTIVDTASSAAGVWVKTNALPVAFTERYSAVAFQIGNYAYVGSGSDAYENPLTDFWRYDPSDDSWTEIVPLPIGRVSAVAFAIDGTGYVGTGWEINRACKPLTATTA